MGKKDIFLCSHLIRPQLAFSKQVNPRPSGLLIFHIAPSLSFQLAPLLLEEYIKFEIFVQPAVTWGVFVASFLCDSQPDDISAWKLSPRSLGDFEEDLQPLDSAELAVSWCQSAKAQDCESELASPRRCSPHQCECFIGKIAHQGASKVCLDRCI